MPEEFGGVVDPVVVAVGICDGNDMIVPARDT
jgi:hypothetical protein